MLMWPRPRTHAPASGQRFGRRHLVGAVLVLLLIVFAASSFLFRGPVPLWALATVVTSASDLPAAITLAESFFHAGNFPIVTRLVAITPHDFPEAAAVTLRKAGWETLQVQGAMSSLGVMAWVLVQQRGVLLVQCGSLILGDVAKELQSAMPDEEAAALYEGRIKVSADYSVVLLRPSLRTHTQLLGHLEKSTITGVEMIPAEFFAGRREQLPTKLYARAGDHERTPITDGALIIGFTGVEKKPWDEERVVCYVPQIEGFGRAQAKDVAHVCDPLKTLQEGIAQNKPATLWWGMALAGNKRAPFLL